MNRIPTDREETRTLGTALRKGRKELDRVPIVECETEIGAASIFGWLRVAVSRVIQSTRTM